MGLPEDPNSGGSDEQATDREMNYSSIESGTPGMMFYLPRPEFHSPVKSPPSHEDEEVAIQGSQTDERSRHCNGEESYISRYDGESEIVSHCSDRAEGGIEIGAHADEVDSTIARENKPTEKLTLPVSLNLPTNFWPSIIREEERSHQLITNGNDRWNKLRIACSRKDYTKFTNKLATKFLLKIGRRKRRSVINKVHFLSFFTQFLFDFDLHLHSSQKSSRFHWISFLMVFMITKSGVRLRAALCILV
ncbi:hypothetical protein QAD02_016057 [Eretmocerus hayati]|uniref:Uncharacterized protein n=1 Tax=Eretmocerus hayati TaxID=131215 RepID=A0ACC2PA56_9HYME|nr:hypothetical protein QAD02_016057 [Eretmocerus hayati]